MKWTADQKKAIETRGKNLLVSAAAGSGKTALLIERIRRIIIEEGVSVDRLLVLTFTRAAASEMKERLSRALMQALSDKDADHATIVEQINLMASASISTLHAFCSSIVREYFQEVGIDPEFALISEAERAIMMQEAMDEVFEAHYLEIPEGEETPFSRLLEMYSDNRSDRGLKALVEKFYQFLSTQPEPQRWCETALARFDMNPDDFWDSVWGEIFQKEMQTELAGAEALLQEVCHWLEDPSEGFEKTKEQLEGDLESVRQVNAAMEADYDTFRVLLNGVSFPRYKGNKKADEAFSDAIKDQRTEAKELVQKWQKQNQMEINEALSRIAAMKAPVETLIALTRDFEQCFSAKKRARNLLDFNDLEAYTLKIFKNPAIAEELRQRFEYIFLDEYQDTNEMQETIIQQIVREDNYFMVGDVKQSIYRFRLADPTIFIEKYHDFQEVAREKDALVTLSQNFRSSAGVIDSVNTVFEKVMSAKLGEVDYDDKARLYKGLSAEGPYRKSEVYVIEMPDHVLEEEAGEWSDAEVEARFIGEKIRAQVGQPFYDTKRDETRILEYRDIAVLMRTITGKGEIFAKVFSEMGIPAYYDGGTNYYESLEIGVIMNLLAIIDNRHQDLPLLSVMTSPIGSFSLEECTDIRLADREHRYYAAVEHYMAAFDNPLSEKLKAFYDRLDHWRAVSRTMDIESFLWKLYTDTGYYHFVGALPGGDTRQNNLKILLKRAGDYKRSTLRGIFYFIQFVNRMKKSGSDMGAPGILSDQDNVVRIMTIHKSKGLEFPFVYLAGMGKHFNKRDNSGVMMFHKRLGICPACINLEVRAKMPTLAQSICTAQNTVEMLSEEMRLLYVAMTRAQEGFIAIGSIGQKELVGRMKQWKSGTAIYQLKKAAGLLDWLMQAVQEGAPAVISEDCRQVETDCFILRLISREEALQEANHGSVDLEEAPESAGKALDREIRRRLDFNYGNLTEEPPGKTSVTALRSLKKTLDIEKPEARLEKPAFMNEQQEIAWDAAQQGSALHMLLEHIDLKALKTALSEDEVTVSHVVESTRQALIHRELLPESLAMTIEVPVVQAFVSTPLFQRLLKARQVHREWAFYYAVSAKKLDVAWKDSEEEVVVQGMIDCAFLEADGWVVLDYKSDRPRTAREEADTLARYREQIEFYGMALAELTGIPVKEKYLCLLKTGRQIPV